MLHRLILFSLLLSTSAPLQGAAKHRRLNNTGNATVMVSQGDVILNKNRHKGQTFKPQNPLETANVIEEQKSSTPPSTPEHGHRRLSCVDPALILQIGEGIINFSAILQAKKQ